MRGTFWNFCQEIEEKRSLKSIVSRSHYDNIIASRKKCDHIQSASQSDAKLPDGNPQCAKCSEES